MEVPRRDGTDHLGKDGLGMDSDCIELDCDPAERHQLSNLCHSEGRVQHDDDDDC